MDCKPSSHFARWRKEIDAERLLGAHLNRIATYRDNHRSKYASSIDTLILLCPKEIRDAALEKKRELGIENAKYECIDDEMRKRYDELFAFVFEQLEREGLIYRKKEISKIESESISERITF